MDEGPETKTDAKRRRRLEERAERMVESGRLTQHEAERLRSADGPGEFDEVVQDIRVRHAGASLAAAVEQGRLGQEEADGFLERLKSGEHSRSLRAQLGRLRPRPDSGASVAGLGGPEGDRQEDAPA